MSLPLPDSPPGHTALPISSTPAPPEFHRSLQRKAFLRAEHAGGKQDRVAGRRPIRDRRPERRSDGSRARSRRRLHSRSAGQAASSASSDRAELAKTPVVTEYSRWFYAVSENALAALD